ncbi:MAG: hypothetical protein E6G94_01905 [Alphaproteobacteria bacterium]|nr:MAG: hypothetical protein E6G94_01905 [Alphaproteobacteria bacterium]
MLFHLSIEADEPRHVAEIFAEIWGGKAFPFPAVTPGSWVAFAGDDRGTMIEVYPRGTAIYEVEGDNDAIGIRVMPRRHSATHMAIGTRLSQEEVFAICERQGWPAKYRLRGGVFGVIEIFVEECQMIEVLTEEMQQQYVSSVTIENWQRMLEARLPLAEAA